MRRQFFSTLFQMHPELPAHTYHLGEVLETVHPTGKYESPARVSLIISDRYVILELLDTGGMTRPVTKCCDSCDPTLLPVGWCEKNNVPLGKPLKQGKLIVLAEDCTYMETAINVR